MFLLLLSSATRSSGSGCIAIERAISWENLSASRIRRYCSRAGGGCYGLSDRPRREVLEGKTVKATYDARTDTLSIIFRPDAVVAESDEDKPGVILDYDQDGNLVSLEILDASSRVSEARRLEFETTG